MKREMLSVIFLFLIHLSWSQVELLKFKNNKIEFRVFNEPYDSLFFANINSLSNIKNRKVRLNHSAVKVHGDTLMLLFSDSIVNYELKKYTIGYEKFLLLERKEAMSFKFRLRKKTKYRFLLLVLSYKLRTNEKTIDQRYLWALPFKGGHSL